MRQEQSMATGRRMGWTAFLASALLVAAHPTCDYEAAKAKILGERTK
jgi:hypothetical protein